MFTRLISTLILAFAAIRNGLACVNVHRPRRGWLSRKGGFGGMSQSVTSWVQSSRTSKSETHQTMACFGAFGFIAASAIGMGSAYAHHTKNSAYTISLGWVSTWVSFALIVATVLFLVYFYLSKRRPDTPATLLNFAGVPMRMIVKAKIDGIDIKKVANVWKSLNAETNFDAWTRFALASSWTRKLTVPRHIRSLSRDRKTTHIVAMLHLVGVSDEDIMTQDVRQMMHLFGQDVPVSGLAYAAENDIDAELFRAFVRNDNLLSMSQQQLAVVV